LSHVVPVGILDQIVDRQRQALAANPPDEGRLRELAADAPAVLDFVGALKDGPEPALIAECKKRSPVRGLLDAAYDVAARARAYVEAGASAVSVLTNADFDGELEDLDRVRAVAGAPVLRKDFVIDPLQLLEARAHGADAVLLIARILEPGVLGEMTARCRDLGIQTLVEVHHESELEAALAARPDMIGVNQRNLETFDVDGGLFARVAPQLPTGMPMVAESGFMSRDQVLAAAAAGARAVLVGEALMTAPDPGAKIRELLGAEVNGGGASAT
jgi:indole-3-glycerol phosphate synthase